MVSINNSALTPIQQELKEEKISLQLDVYQNLTVKFLVIFLSFSVLFEFPTWLCYFYNQKKRYFQVRERERYSTMRDIELCDVSHKLREMPIHLSLWQHTTFIIKSNSHHLRSAI